MEAIKIIIANMYALSTGIVLEASGRYFFCGCILSCSISRISLKMYVELDAIQNAKKA